MEQRVDAVAFPGIGSHLATIILRIHVNVNVRVLPGDFRDHSGHREGLVHVDFSRERVMRENRLRRRGQQHHTGDQRTNPCFFDFTE